MKVSEMLEQFESWRGDERIRLAGLHGLLCGVSLQTLREFQDGWDGSRPYEEFVVEQNKVFRQCVELEMHELGAGVRRELGLDPLTLDTEVDDYVVVIVEKPHVRSIRGQTTMFEPGFSGEMYLVDDADTRQLIEGGYLKLVPTGKLWEREYENASDVEAQAAYVEAVSKGFGFSASNGGWHWFDSDAGVIYSRRSDNFKVHREVTETPVDDVSKWIEHAPRLEVLRAGK